MLIYFILGFRVKKYSEIFLGQVLVSIWWQWQQQKRIDNFAYSVKIWPAFSSVHKLLRNYFALIVYHHNLFILLVLILCVLLTMKSNNVLIKQKKFIFKFLVFRSCLEKSVYLSNEYLIVVNSFMMGANAWQTCHMLLVQHLMWIQEKNLSSSSGVIEYLCSKW